MKYFGYSALTATLMGGATPAGAQSAQQQFSTIRACTSAIVNNDIEIVREIADQMLAWESVSATFVSRARQCVEAAFGEVYEYYPSLGFATQEEIEEFQAEQEVLQEEREIRQSEAALRTLLSTLSDLHELMNENLVTASVYEACLNLARTEPDSTFTNQTCVSSFRQNGHPELESFAAFAVSASPLVLERLEPRERELLDSLNEEQVEQLCQGEFTALCTLAGVSE